MPTYESKCKTCDAVYVYFTSIAKRDETPECCGKKTERMIITPPMGFVDTPAAKQD